MAAPNTEDAHLYLQLLEMTQQPQFVDARHWVVYELDTSTAKEFNEKYHAGADERSRVTTVLTFYDSVGALVSRGLLHEDLFFDAPLGFEVVWPRVEALVVDWQKAARDDPAWENVTWLARRFESWRASTWRPKLEAIPTDRPPTKQWGEGGEHHVGFSKG
ncbi:MAG TPA: DUF4760 domain-containing protein [Candidatus Dormibacteraeota bacterium]|jgi:hypothetical protein